MEGSVFQLKTESPCFGHNMATISRKNKVCLLSQPKNFFIGIHAIPNHRNMYILHNEDYVEK